MATNWLLQIHAALAVSSTDSCCPPGRVTDNSWICECLVIRSQKNKKQNRNGRVGGGGVCLCALWTHSNFYGPPRDHNKKLIDSLWAAGWEEGEFLQEVNTNQTLSEPLRSGATPAESRWVTVAVHVRVCVCVRAHAFVYLRGRVTQTESREKKCERECCSSGVDIYLLPLWMLLLHNHTSFPH